MSFHCNILWLRSPGPSLLVENQLSLLFPSSLVFNPRVRSIIKETLLCFVRLLSFRQRRLTTLDCWLRSALPSDSVIFFGIGYAWKTTRNSDLSSLHTLSLCIHVSSSTRIAFCVRCAFRTEQDLIIKTQSKHIVAPLFFLLFLLKLVTHRFLCVFIFNRKGYNRSIDIK